MAVIAKYKFNSTLYADLVPEFNAEFTNYVVTDETTETDSEGNVIKTRVIEHDTLLPTLMRFGQVHIDNATDNNNANRCNSLLEVLEMNTSVLTSMNSMFRLCREVTSIECNWNTCNVTDMFAMFGNCINLTTLDVSNFNTSNVNSMYGVFYECINLTSLDVSNWDTDNVTNMSWMFYSCINLTTLDVSNWDTDNVTNMYSMFRNCTNLTSLDLSNFNTSKVDNMGYMFYGCNNLISLDVSNFDTKNVTNMANIFQNCTNLTSLDLSNFDTKNVTNMSAMFHQCINLTSLDLSNFNISNVTDMSYMFYGCNNLTQLDLSNFDTSNMTSMSHMFYNTSKLKDIGMLYCSQSTINTLSSNIPTPSTNVWVEGSMINDLTSYDNVTYKAYYWEKEVLLNSPLLEGDKIVKKDGKIYHYHKMGMIVLDGSESWHGNSSQPNENLHNRYIAKEDAKSPDGKIFSDNFKHVDKMENEGMKIGNYAPTIYVAINKTKLSEPNANGFKQWFSENPTTVVYELANPYYELISDTSDDLSLSLLSEDNIISNNSLIPTNMNIKNNGMSTVAMQSSTKYTVAFDKDTDSSVTIDLCGSTIDTTDNVVEITTPSELANDEITFIGDCEVSNVRILEGSVSGDAIPRESFEGLKNSFEDGKLPSEDDNVLHNDLRYFDSKIIYGLFKSSIKLNTLYTAKVIDNTNKVMQTQISTGDGSVLWRDRTSDKIFKFTTSISSDNVRFYVYSEKELDTSSTNGFTEEDKANINIIVLEGDWTHLTEEDWNNLGKYKIEYKVTGKNKFPSNEKYEFEQNISREYIIKNIYLRKGEHVISFNSGNLDISVVRCYLYDYNNKTVKREDGGSVHYNTSTIKIPYSGYYKLRIDRSSGNTPITSGVLTNVQIEEGTTITEYEPYKSYTKTFYLNSPLLEGDTIEDVNGVATHVKRSEMVVLDGSESWRDGTKLGSTMRCYAQMTNPNKIGSVASVSDKLPHIYHKYNEAGNIVVNAYELDVEHYYSSSSDGIYLFLNLSELPTQNIDGFKQWLQANPVTVVYELASPQYEPISTESILCDSYVNGHLDVDSNIPIEKVMFKYPVLYLKYLVPNTEYCIKFESDNIGKVSNLYMTRSSNYNASITKGNNEFLITTSSEVTNPPYLVIEGIGFNASNIQVVATDRDNIGYFKGIQSSFEDKIVVSENLFDVNNIIINSMAGDNGNIQSTELYNRTDYIECKSNTPYTCNYGTGINYYDKNKVWLGYLNHNILSPSGTKYLIKNLNKEYNIDTYEIKEVIEDKYEVKVTLEDENGVISNEFIYLNSPLLKGDRIEMYNGKLSHYHKMGKVVLDGSEDEGWFLPDDKINDNGIMFVRSNYCLPNSMNMPNKFIIADTLMALPSGSQHSLTGLGQIIRNASPAHSNVLYISTDKTTKNDFNLWLSENPATVVYELAEPYYEDITPIQNEFVITSIGESSFTINSGAIPTDGEITYSVNVKLLNDLEESINNNTSSTDTDLSTILDDIINE